MSHSGHRPFYTYDYSETRVYLPYSTRSFPSCRDRHGREQVCSFHSSLRIVTHIRRNRKKKRNFWRRNLSVYRIVWGFRHCYDFFGKKWLTEDVFVEEPSSKVPWALFIGTYDDLRPTEWLRLHFETRHLVPDSIFGDSFGSSNFVCYNVDKTFSRAYIH